MLILQVAFMLHFACIQGFILEVQNSPFSNHVTRMKTNAKTLTIKMGLSNRQNADESKEFGSSESEEAEQDISMEALLQAQEGAPNEFAIMKEVRVTVNYRL